MEIKKFNEYTKEEQKELLFHWWHYYGKLPVTLDEMGKFYDMLDTDSKIIRDVALVAFAKNVSSEDYIRAMRGDFEQYSNSITSYVKSSEFMEIEEALEEEFIAMLVNSYNNPESSKGVSEEKMIEGLREIYGEDIKNAKIINVSLADLMKKKEDEGPVLTCDKVQEIYVDCLFKNKELVDGEPALDFTVGEGVRRIAYFNSERLAKNKEKIIKMVDELQNIDQGPSFLNLCTDKHGRLWTGEHEMVDYLVQLGVAVGALFYPLPREMWGIVGGLPFVARNHEKDNEDLKTHGAKEFKKVQEKIQNGTYGKDAKK